MAELADGTARSHDLALEAISHELDKLRAIMESQFSHEERAISEALEDGIPDTGWSDRVLR